MVTNWSITEKIHHFCYVHIFNGTSKSVLTALWFINTFPLYTHTNTCTQHRIFCFSWHQPKTLLLAAWPYSLSHQPLCLQDQSGNNSMTRMVKVVEGKWWTRRLRAAFSINDLDNSEDEIKAARPRTHYFPASLFGFIEKHLIQYYVNLMLKQYQQCFQRDKKGCTLFRNWKRRASLMLGVQTRR